MNLELKDIDVVVLCGGKGERIRSVLPDKPKVLATIKGTPLLDILISKLYEQGARRFVLCVGYLRDQIQKHIDDIKNEGQQFRDASFVFSEESEPLGTGGALKNATKL